MNSKDIEKLWKDSIIETYNDKFSNSNEKRNIDQKLFNELVISFYTSVVCNFTLKLLKKLP